MLESEARCKRSTGRESVACHVKRQMGRPRGVRAAPMASGEAAHAGSRMPSRRAAGKWRRWEADQGGPLLRRPVLGEAAKYWEKGRPTGGVGSEGGLPFVVCRWCLLKN
ncbi:hypothetical protein B0H67DRAFT_330933 [Lasiosphaeris hirsuta]|uniref:Uncharacterized protein n=1 Tax=Lasiosphaeris hirsuta TaxID=260670 RepID=A0AA40A324_9PEZI|nr:hypothetical protein B0H67DRAFT_330933 [Lasiosphaeris hirsuta]